MAQGNQVPWDHLPALEGQVLGHSAWYPLTQEQVDAFGATTLDRQWIHTDPARAADGPFGRAIAHGFLTLSLSTVLIGDVLEVPDAGLVVNYGLNRVRFPAPAPVGCRLRAKVTCTGVEDLPGCRQLTLLLEYEVDGQAKPPCVAEIVFRYYLRD